MYWIGNGYWGCTGDKRLDVAAQNPNRTHLLKLGVVLDLLGGDKDQSGRSPRGPGGSFQGAGGKGGRILQGGTEAPFPPEEEGLRRALS